MAQYLQYVIYSSLKAFKIKNSGSLPLKTLTFSLINTKTKLAHNFLICVL